MEPQHSFPADLMDFNAPVTEGSEAGNQSRDREQRSLSHPPLTEEKLLWFKFQPHYLVAQFLWQKLDELSKEIVVNLTASARHSSPRPGCANS